MPVQVMIIGVFFDVKNPERVCLRQLLDGVMKDEAEGAALDLQPVRRLVAALVQTSGRHTIHGMGPPVPGKHPCARGTAACPCCRYGFPHDRISRHSSRQMHLVKGDRLGSWHARFPRNDALCCSYEPHILLSNLSNIDFRPCLNLWAVVEYITKYATKAPEGSRRLGGVEGCGE